MWAPFKTLFIGELVESGDYPSEKFHLYYPTDAPETKKTQMKRGGRFLDRLYLGEIPFLIVRSDLDLEDEFVHHMGWDIYFPHVSCWRKVLQEHKKGWYLFNNLAQEIIDKIDIEPISNFMELYRSHNFHLFIDV